MEKWMKKWKLNEETGCYLEGWEESINNTEGSMQRETPNRGKEGRLKQRKVCDQGRDAKRQWQRQRQRQKRRISTYKRTECHVRTHTHTYTRT